MPFAAYLELAAANRALIAFGFVMAFGSSFGQTFFIGIFGPEIQREFGLSHTAWGTIYMLGTLASAALLPWSGKQIDRLHLRDYALMVCFLLVAACLVTSLVAGALSLTLAIFLLRQSGQGLMSHVALTSMVRYFDAHRGRAIAVATLGFAAGEALLPFVAVLAIGWIGWRWSYASIALIVAVVLVPGVMRLLKGHDARHRAHLERLAEHAARGEPVRRSWSRAEVLRDSRFYLLLPGILAPPMVLTAMFFHQLNLADAKGWTHAWITASYVIYAVTTVVTSLSVGPLIDRVGALRLVPVMLSPLTLALLVVAVFDSAFSAWPYLALAGLNTGFAHTAVSAMWAEVYGVGNLGAIKALVTALGVFASALGPVTMGALMDLGMPIERVCLLFAGYTVVGALLITLAIRSPVDAAPR